MAGAARVVEVDRCDGRADHALVALVEDVAERLDQRARRAPGEHAAWLAVDQRRLGAGHPAQEEVQDAGDVLVSRRSRAPASAGSGAARPCTAAPAARSGGGASRSPAPTGGGARPSAPRRAARASSSCSRRSRSAARGAVRPAHAQDEVDAAGEVAAHARAAAPDPRAARRSRAGGRRRQVLAQHGGDRGERQPAGRLVAADERQLEVELVQPVGAGDIAEAQTVQQRAERRPQRRASARRRRPRASRARRGASPGPRRPAPRPPPRDRAP